MADYYRDTFDEAADIALESHTPTGEFAGSGWTSHSGANSVRVIASTDLAKQNSDVVDGVYNINNDVNSDMVAEGWFTRAGSGHTGVAVRMTAADVSNNGIIFGHDGSSWKMVQDLVGGDLIVTAAGSWPGGTVLIRAEIRGRNFKGFVNGVLMLQTDTISGHDGNTRGGISLGIGIANNCTVDDFFIGAASPEPGNNQPALKPNLQGNDTDDGRFNELDVRNWV